AFESQGSFNEALGRWEAIRKVHPRYPGLAFQVDRLTVARDRAALSEALTRWRGQIDQCLTQQDFERAFTLCTSALGEFPKEASLEERQDQALTGIELAAKAKMRIEQAGEFIAQGNLEEALRILRSAQDLPVRSPMAKVLFVDALTRSAWA